MEPTAMINPKILAHSDNLVKDWVGCLSVPGWGALVPRYQTIEVEYRDRTDGEYGNGISHFLISWLKLTGLIIAIKIML